MTAIINFGSNNIHCKLYYSNHLNVSHLIKQHYLRENWWNVLIWVTGHCNRAAV